MSIYLTKSCTRHSSLSGQTGGTLGDVNYTRDVAAPAAASIGGISFTFFPSLPPSSCCWITNGSCHLILSFGQGRQTADPSFGLDSFNRCRLMSLILLDSEKMKVVD